jgi:hypothetical protein
VEQKTEEVTDQPPLRDGWSGRLDSNQRPLAPHASALPGCATPRLLLDERDWSISTRTLSLLSHPWNGQARPLLAAPSAVYVPA